MVKMSFDELSKAILKYNAKSFLQQGSIVILRDIFKEKEEISKSIPNKQSMPSMPTIFSHVAERFLTGACCTFCHGTRIVIFDSNSRLLQCRTCKCIIDVS